LLLPALQRQRLTLKQVLARLHFGLDLSALWCF